jgi:RNase H-fold protein (predicted Holliday junction resolvase)
MPLQRIQIVVGLLCFLSGVPLSRAQAPSYHAEVMSGFSGNIAMVNESDKTIEAFHLKAVCGKTTEGDTTYDALTWPGDRVPTVPVDGGQIANQSDVVLPHTRMFSSMPLDAQPSGCMWTVEVNGVIFSDGTYSGSQEVVQLMQAWRDGLAASIRYWADRLRTSAADQAFNIQDEAKKRSKEDQSKELDPRSLAGQYWLGRFLVDEDLAQISQPSGTDSTRRALWRRQYPSQMVNEWQAKLDNDKAFKRLDAILPLRPEMFQPTHPPKTAEPCTPSQHK